MPEELITARIEGEEKVIAAFAAAPGLARQVMTRTMEQANQLMLGTLKPYPPQPPRDRARTFNTYVRGVGHYPRSAFPGGQLRQRLTKRQGGQIRRTSEQLGKRWRTQVKMFGVGILGMTENTASYAKYVQGQEQPLFHLQTGWVTTFAAKMQNLPRIVQMFRDAASQVVAAVRRMMGG